MTRHAPGRLAAPLTALVLVLSACSGGGDEPAAQEEVDPKEVYLEQASEVCSTADEEFAALTPPTTPAEFGPFVQQTVQIADRAHGQLAAITPPEEDWPAIESKVLTPFAALVEEGKAWSAEVSAAGADQAALLPLLEERPTSAGIDKEFLREYGLTSCADAISKVG